MSLSNPPKEPDQVNLCKGCNTMKHLDANGLCGRCQPDQVDAPDEIEFLKRLKLELDANVSQYAGERWDDSDAAILVNDRIKELEKQREET